MVVLQVRSQQESLKKPTRVGQMPLGRTGVGHGLDHLVFGGQSFADRLSRKANGSVLLEKRRGLPARQSGRNCSLDTQNSSMKKPLRGLCFDFRRSGAVTKINRRQCLEAVGGREVT